jgi:hypothetical protein
MQRYPDKTLVGSPGSPEKTAKILAEKGVPVRVCISPPYIEQLCIDAATAINAAGVINCLPKSIARARMLNPYENGHIVAKG